MKYLKLAALSSVIALTALTATAHDHTESKPASQPASMQKVEVPTYAVDTVHSSIVFGIKHNNLNLVFGSFNKFDGTIKFHPDNLADSSMEITVDVTSVDTNNEGRDEHIQDNSYFNTAEAPKAMFKSKRIEHVSGKTYKVMGDLTIGGETQPLTFNFDYAEPKQDKWGNTKTGATTEITLDRTQFGQTGGLDSGLARKVTVMISLQAAEV